MKFERFIEEAIMVDRNLNVAANVAHLIAVYVVRLFGLFMIPFIALFVVFVPVRSVKAVLVNQNYHEFFVSLIPLFLCSIAISLAAAFLIWKFMKVDHRNEKPHSEHPGENIQ